MLLWQDIFRPFVENNKGIKSGPLTRWFDNNTFFRQPVITGNLDTTDPFVFKYIHSKANKAILPGPMLFYSCCKNNSFKDKQSLLMDIVYMLRKEIKDLSKRGIEIIQLNEPSLSFVTIPKLAIELAEKDATFFNMGRYES